MADESEVQRIIQEGIESLATNGKFEIKAVMGKPDGTVKTSEFGRIVWVTLAGNGFIMKVFNDRVPFVPYKKVIVGYDPASRNPNLIQVLRLDPVYADEQYPNLTNHGFSHRWFDYDRIDVYSQQFMPLLPRWAGDLTVRIHGGAYKVNGLRRLMNNIDIDMTSHVVGAGAQWVNCEIDELGVITFQGGELVESRDKLTLDKIPVTESTKKLLFSARMYQGQTEFIETPSDYDIYDPRFEGGVDGGASSAGGTGDMGWDIEGAIAVTNGAGIDLLITKNVTLDAVYLYLENPGSSGSTIIDVILNQLCPVSIFNSLCSEFPELQFNDSNQWVKLIPAITDFVEGDVLSLDILQVAAGAAGLRVILGVATAESGGSSPDDPDVPPDVPDAMDDEFEAFTLDGKWTSVISSGSTAVVAFTNTRVLLGRTTQATESKRHCDIWQALPVGNCRFRAKLRLESPGNNYTGIGMGVRVASSGRSHGLYMITHSSYAYNTLLALDTTGDTFNAESPVAVLPAMQCYLEIEVNATNIIYRHSQTGENYTFSDLAVIALGAIGTIDQIGIVMHPYTGGNTSSLGSCDWFRRMA